MRKHEEMNTDQMRSNDMNFESNLEINIRNDFLNENNSVNLSMKDPDEIFTFNSQNLSDSEDNAILNNEPNLAFVESESRNFTENNQQFFLDKRSSDKVFPSSLIKLLTIENQNQPKLSLQKKQEIPLGFLNPTPDKYIKKNAPKLTLPSSVPPPRRPWSAEFDHSKEVLNNYLHSFFEFLDLYFLEEDNEKLKKCYANLDPKVQKMVSSLLKKINKETSLKKILNSTTFKKRNEEMIKMIYKPALKHFIKKFQRYSSSASKFPGIINSACLLQKFHYNCFKELVKNDLVPLDVIMDISAELTNKKKTIPFVLNRENNWTTKKFRKLRKISTHYRYLIKLTSNFSYKFREYIKKKLKTKLKKNIQEKLNKKKKFWENLLNESTSFSHFLSQFQADIHNPKFKCPWSLRNISRSIDFCLKELEENSDLETNFEMLKKSHYSY